MELINKNRSVSSCIREGYRLFRGNLRNILVSSWKELTAASLLFATLVSVAVYMDSLVACAVLVLAFLECFVRFKACVFDMIDYRPYKWNVRRMRVVVVMALAAVVVLSSPAVVASVLGEPSSASRITVAAVSAVLLCLLLPLLQVGLDIIMAEHPRPWKAFLAGLRRWGFLFLMVLLSGLICSVVMVIVGAPLSIALYSAVADQQGLAAGDPTGLPSWFAALLYLTAAVSFFAAFYIQTWQTFAMAFAYGSISYKKEQQ